MSGDERTTLHAHSYVFFPFNKKIFSLIIEKFIDHMYCEWEKKGKWCVIINHIRIHKNVLKINKDVIYIYIHWLPLCGFSVFFFFTVHTLFLHGNGLKQKKIFFCYVTLYLIYIHHFPLPSSFNWWFGSKHTCYSYTYVKSKINIEIDYNIGQLIFL